MRQFYLLLTFAAMFMTSKTFAQCPPPGFPEPGNTCPEAPVLCEDINGYCATVNNNNVVQNFPGCPSNVLNNDEWFAFFAGTPSITLEITPSNCQNSNNQGLQGGIYGGCINQIMATQCACEEDPFILASGAFVVGEIYWLVIDGCAGNVCDYTVAVLDGSTVPFPPDDPGPIDGPVDACVDGSDSYSILPPNGATEYTWTLDPPLGTVSGDDDEDININWGGAPGTAELCVQVANFCEINPNLSCITIEVHPDPTATLSGMGEVCKEGASTPVELTIDFTGDAPWTFTYNTPDGPVGPITTSDNPYIIMVDEIGSYSLESVASSDALCEGTVSGTVEITGVELTIDGTPTTATCMQENGSIDITSVTGGEAPYTFSWDSGQTSEDLDDIPSGTYEVTATDANGCEGTATFEVPETANEPTPTATTTPSECGLENGSIDVTTTGGTAPYTYVWGGGETTEDLDDVPSGTYVVTVTAADGCTAELTVTLDNEDPPITITGTVVANTTCLAGGNGSITTMVSPQPAPAGGTYTYEWDTGETTPDLTDVPPGSYTLTVTTGNSCTGMATFVIPDEPIEPTISFIATESLCGLENGAIDISVLGGEAPFTFSWDNGETTEDLMDIPEGTYSVTVTGANGCTDEAAITVINNEPPITVTADIEPNEGCGPGNWDGSITINILPGVSPTGDPYIITWDNGATTTTITDLEPGSYTVTVNGGGTCETIETFTIDDQPNEPSINVTVVPAECGLSNGSATISVTGGVAPFDILWSDGSTDNFIENVIGGNYSVTVTGANGCSAEAPVIIPDNPITFNVTADIVPNSACDPSLNDGSITITVIPTTNTYTITWSTGDTGPSITALGGDTYSVTVSAGGTCEDVFTFNVPNIPEEPGINLVPQNAECGQSNGVVFTQSTGAGVFPFTYIWSNGATTPTLSDVPAGNYSVTVTGANGCSTVASTNVGDDEIPITLNAIVVNNTSCLIPGTGNGSIELDIITTGIPVITWSNGATGTVLTDLDPGTYTVTVSVGGTCEEILPITILDEAEIPNLSITQTPASCGQMDGAADLMIIGGVPPYTFLWDNGATTEDLFGVVSGPYNVTVTTAAGCTAESFVNINENTIVFDAIPNVTPNTSCGAPVGMIELTVTPPGNYTYLWYNGETSPFISDLPGGFYDVTITAAGNCSQTFAFEVPDLIVPPNATASATAATCGLDNGAIDLTVTGGALPYLFQWSNGESTEDLVDVPPGTYTVLITDANFCLATAEVTVGDNNVPINITADVTDNTSCSNENGGINITVDPPGTSYTFDWSNGATTEDLTNVAAGTYTVIVSAGGNCESTATFTIEDDTAAPFVEETITAAICGEANGSIDLTVTGSATPYTFIWSNGATTEDLIDLLPGPYTVTVTAANSCTTEQTYNVTNNSSSFSLDGTVVALTSCINDNGEIDLIISPAGNYTIAWTHGPTTEDLTNLPAGTYEVVVTESGSCSASATFVVEDETSFPLIAQTIEPELCGQEDGIFDISVSGGAMPYTFLWSNGATTEDLLNVAGGSYTVTVTGANGCTAESSATIPANTISFSISGTPEANTSCAMTNGAIDISIAPAGNYTFEWSNGETTEDLTGLAGGSYSVIVSAGGDCTASANFSVPSTTEDPSIQQDVMPSICGESNGGIDLTISGGVAPYTFLWSNGETTEDLMDVLAGTYSVEVTGANGCVSSANFTVADNPVVISITGDANANNSCDTPNGTVNIDITPISTTYTYLWSNGAATEDLSDLPPGNYTVTVFEGATCEATANFTVANNTNAPDISASIIDAVCGQASGDIDLSPVGGTQPYTFLWSNGASTEDLEDVLPGIYDVVVTGADGCSNTGSYTVGDELITIDITGETVANTACLNGNGTITLEVLPAGTYVYNWSNGSTSQNVQDLLPGSYEVTVSASGDCSAVASFIIADSPVNPSIAETITASICGQPDGAIDLTIDGGLAPYTFLWSNGETTEDLMNILSGDYDVEVTDALGCVVSATFNVANNSNTFSIDGTTSSNTLCIGENGLVDLDVTPAGTYGYIWSNGAVTEDLIDVASGDYTVTVTDGGTCTASATFMVLNDAPAIDVSGLATDVLCFGDLTGSIEITATGGVEPYTYGWTPAIPNNPEDPIELGAGDYVVVVTDASGCTGSASVTINQPMDDLQISCAQTVAVSLPGLMDGEGTININGGTAPYTASWSPGGSLDNLMAGNLVIDNLGEGLYDVLVVDANGCETVCDFVIGTNDCITAVGTMSNDIESTCGDGCLSGTYDDFQQLLDADDLLEFVLHTGTINQIVGELARNDQPTFCFDALTMSYGQTYYISAVAGNDDGTGQVDLGDDCTQVSFGTPIVFNELPVASIAPPDSISCDDPSVLLTGMSSLAGSLYSWNTLNGSIISNTDLAAITVDEGGDYVLIVENSGCFDTTSVPVIDVAVDLQVSITASPTEILDCTIDAINLMGMVVGTTNGEYNWTYNGQFVSSNATITVDEAGTYLLVVTDPVSGCTGEAEIFIDDNTDFPPLVIDAPPVLNCLDSVGTLSGSSPINGVEFFWATINGTDTTIIGNGSTTQVNAPGTYYLIGIATNECTNIISVEVTGNIDPPTVNAGDDQSLDCYQNPIDLVGSSTSGNVTYNWTVDNPNAVIDNPDNSMITVDDPGVYTLTVTQLDNNCQAIDQVVVDLYDNVPQGDLELTSPDCFGDTNGSITVETDPANGPYEYSLNGISNGDNNFFAPLSGGNYVLEVTDGQGCTWSDVIYLAEPDPLVAELGADIIVELGASVTIQVQYTVPTDQLDTILWNPSELFPCPIMPCDVMEIAPVDQTNIEVTVIDTNGCAASDVLALFVRKDRQIYIPNAFSPNGDGTNDVFMIYSDDDVLNIKSFLVFSRWGETVFEYHDFVPNNPAFGWDGKHRGEVLNPAVFAWFAEVEFVDGQVVLFEGDVNLTR